jgi:hypothetical protein
MKTGYERKKSNEMNGGFNQLNELHRQIELGQLFHESNQPGEIPEGENEPENARDSALAFNGAVGYVTNRQQLRTILLMRNERELRQELRCEERHERQLAHEIAEGKFEFGAGCDCPPDPALN